MKYEEIEVGESVKNEHGYIGEVISKSDKFRVVTTIENKEDYCPLSWLESELELFQPIKKELPESGLLVHSDGSLIFRTGETSGYGFDIFDIFHRICRSFIDMPQNWRTATPEDEAKFIKLLKAEAEKRGLGVDAKIKGHVGGGYPRANNGNFTPKINLTLAFNKHGRIFSNGIWAEPLTMLDDVCDTIKKHLPNIVVEMTDGVVTLKQL